MFYLNWMGKWWPCSMVDVTNMSTLRWMYSYTSVPTYQVRESYTYFHFHFLISIQFVANLVAGLPRWIVLLLPVVVLVIKLLIIAFMLDTTTRVWTGHENLNAHCTPSAHSHNVNLHSIVFSNVQCCACCACIVAKGTMSNKCKYK